MDPSLFTAAVEGNTKSLLKLLRDDPLILERVSSAGADTPLHISAMLGHLPFVKELIKHKIDVMNFILELNQHGFSAVHMASANGHIEVVTELLKVAGPRAVNLKGKDGTTPLHCACVKGKAAIVSHLLEEYGDVRVAISEATVRRENSLHLAMKNNQFQVLEVLVEKIKMNNLFELLNSKDEEGNTALHLAAARRNRQAIELLLRCNISNPGVLQLNALNHSRLTALDVVLMFPCDSIYNDVEILKYSGAERGCFLNNNPPIIDQPSDVQQQTLALASSSRSSKRKNSSRGEIVNLEEYFQFHSEDSDPNQVRNDLLVVAVLVATATYAAGINPPGGVREDGPRQGEARLASNMGSFILFMFFNSLGFYISLNILTVLTGTYCCHTGNGSHIRHWHDIDVSSRTSPDLLLGDLYFYAYSCCTGITFCQEMVQPETKSIPQAHATTESV